MRPSFSRLASFVARACAIGVFPLVTTWATRGVEARAERAGRQLGVWLDVSGPRVAPPSPTTSDRPPAVALEPLPDLTSRGVPAESPRRRIARTKARPPSAIVVRADTVLSLAKAGFVPRASAVGARAGAPAGMRLSGVSRLGLGVLDGDILLDVEGVPASDRAAVVGAVVAARSRHDKVLGATLWRSGHRIRLSVEMPYVFSTRRAG